MTLEEVIQALLDALNARNVPHVLTGSLASSYHGIPRSTLDVDVVVELGAVQIKEIAELLGSEFLLDPQMSFETATLTTRYVIEAKGASFKIELFLLSDDPYDQERFPRRQHVKYLGRDSAILTPEDVIITKLRWYKMLSRSKDWADARNVASVQLNNLDWAYIERWCREHSTEDLLSKLPGELKGHVG